MASSPAGTDEGASENKWKVPTGILQSQVQALGKEDVVRGKCLPVKTPAHTQARVGGEPRGQDGRGEASVRAHSAQLAAHSSVGSGL